MAALTRAVERPYDAEKARARVVGESWDAKADLVKSSILTGLAGLKAGSATAGHSRARGSLIGRNGAEISI